MGALFSMCFQPLGARSTTATCQASTSNVSTDTAVSLYEQLDCQQESALTPLDIAPATMMEDEALSSSLREKNVEFTSVVRTWSLIRKEPSESYRRHDWIQGSAKFRENLTGFGISGRRRHKENEGGYVDSYARNTDFWTPKSVSDTHKWEGTIVNASRGCHDNSKFVDSIHDCGIKQDINELFTPLTKDEEDKVHQAMHDGHSGEILVTHEPSNIQITRDVLQCLSTDVWLNDEVINLYIELLKEREKREPEKFLKCHFFNTFFYKKLINGKNGYDFKAVRRWTTQRNIEYNLSDCDKIFFPIHRNVHWCLAVIDLRHKKFQYLDSLGGFDWTVLHVLERYFIDEVNDKRSKEIDIGSWTWETVLDLPLQRNVWDCGMFMLKYMDFYSRGVPLSFGQDDMLYFRNRTAIEVLRLRAE